MASTSTSKEPADPRRCYDPGCQRPATRQLLGNDMCKPHYLEALEHCAHIGTRAPAQLAAERKAEDARLGWLIERFHRGGILLNANQL